MPRHRRRRLQRQRRKHRGDAAWAEMIMDACARLEQRLDAHGRALTEALNRHGHAMVDRDFPVLRSRAK